MGDIFYCSGKGKFGSPPIHAEGFATYCPHVPTEEDYEEWDEVEEEDFDEIAEKWQVIFTRHNIAVIVEDVVYKDLAKTIPIRLIISGSNHAKKRAAELLKTLASEGL